MTVISVSLTDKNLENLDKLQKTLGLAGRSETVRVCVRAAEDELREREKLEGDVEGILIVIHQADNDHGLEEAIHEYKGVIATQVHSHLKNGKCLDVFLVGGKAEAIKEMLSFFQGAESLEYTKFVQS
jgi:CopG family nickel-responsive transcriptional regulator